jgi:hypothetical protein
MNSKESPEVWTPPELTVLVRNKPEEAVLETCKMFTGGGPWPTGGVTWGHWACMYAEPCPPCTDSGAS